MLYLSWLETVRRYAQLPAIYEGARMLTFADLASALAELPKATAPVIARSHSPDFFLQILRGWRDGQAVIPVERDEVTPILACPPPPEICLVKYTPGAGGVARGIFFTAAQVAADCQRLVHAMGLSARVPNLSAISLAHSYGFSSVVLPLLLHGVPVHLAAVPFPRLMDEIFRCHPKLVLPAVPSMWRAWHRAGILKNAPIQLALSAGAPLSLALETEVFSQANLKIHNFYGASECGAIAWDSSDCPRTEASHIGSLLVGVAISINPAGCISVQSDAVASGYDEALTADELGAGCYQTRDLGHLDPHGNLHLTGSLGGAINVAGRKISPTKVEAAIIATGLVARAKVFAVPSNDAERFEEIAALVEMSPGATLHFLKHAMASALQLWAIPRHWKTEAHLWNLDPTALRQEFLR
jgi:long-chain acyl-CoA synthetase